MSIYVVLKWLHILSATVLFGTGIGIAFFKWTTDLTRDVRAIRIVNERTVLADWLFTTPAVILQPVTGVGLAHLAGFPLWSGWVFWAMCLYALAGACWLPVVWLQLRMQALARTADADGSELSSRYWAFARAWFWLGVPAFLSLLAVYGLMVFKPAF